ncbi:hypothetical protein T11_5315 [Trichinella zimbabwensis]|uniref:Uncharacterized protein n=1 Tax=Trichinella zimbabwensis TaxID=268475 RepID=A0A0V1I1N1_9BILA|nr:hypothetical protein T11_5315 [Trichinella zimbabwensis]
MPSGKRETERKGNAPVNTGPSPNSDGRANNLVEEADEPARGSGPCGVPSTRGRELLSASLFCTPHYIF